MKLVNSIFAIIAIAFCSCTQSISNSTVKDSEGNAIEGVEVFVKETGVLTTTNEKGEFSLEQPNVPVTIVFGKEGYMYEQLLKQESVAGLSITMKKSVQSAAAKRLEIYAAEGCDKFEVPENTGWEVEYVHSELKGDLAPDYNYTRRDPSAVIKVDSLYYMWYSYSPSIMEDKRAPWDLNDLYYATSVDGVYWEEKGAAVERGPEGSFDHRSVFTTEVFAHEGKYYLVYQAAADLDGIYDRNTVCMSYADSPDGPWTKLEKPVLYPTYTHNIYFDNNAVHDPCIISYNDKFYMYYKGECNCLDNDDCKVWCNPICGKTYHMKDGSTFVKQVKWGVAVADSPTGPYVKSEHNPITNTGHEVMVWPYKDGVCILQHQDGVESNTIQFAKDGVNFEIMGAVDGIPEAAGLYRTDKSDDNPHAGAEWGVAHYLRWDHPEKSGNGWMYIHRFDKKVK